MRNCSVRKKHINFNHCLKLLNIRPLLQIGIQFKIYNTEEHLIIALTLERIVKELVEIGDFEKAGSYMERLLGKRKNLIKYFSF